MDSNPIELFPIELWVVILEFCEFKTKIKLIQSCQYFNYNLYIYDLINIDNKYLELLKNSILQQYKFRFVVKLNAKYSSKITNVSFMKNLKELNAEGYYGINQKSIEGLDLVKLDVSYNSKITNVSFMKNLKEFSARGSCGINQEGIEGLDLVKLDVSYKKH